MLSAQQRFYEERYCRFLILEALQTFQQLQQDLESEFILWTFLQHLDLLKQHLDKEFVLRHTDALYALLPPKKADRLFVHSLKNQEQRLVFDRMLNSQFEDIKRILKSNSPQLSEEERFHLFNFLRIKLPELFADQRPAIFALLQHRPGPDFVLASQAALIKELLQSEFFTQWLKERPESVHTQEYRQFLKEKALEACPEMDRLIVMSLISMDLFHEKAHLFETEHRQILTQLLNFTQSVASYMTEAVFVRESFLKELEEHMQRRARALYQLESGLLRPLYEELQVTHRCLQQHQQLLQIHSPQADPQLSEQMGDTQVTQLQQRFKELNELYTRHMDEISQKFYKRLETLEKFKDKPTEKKLKPYFMKKLESCLRYIPRAKQQIQPINICYQRWSEQYLLNQQMTWLEQVTWENDYEKLIAQRAFSKARNVLNGIHQSKGTVKLNLRQLFGDQLRKDTCISLLQEVLVELWQIAQAQPDETTDFLMRHLEIYFKGIGLPDSLQPSGLSVEERAGYILAYLAQNEHIKLLVDLKYHQIIYDWNSLFNLSHALMILDSRIKDAQASLETHFLRAMDPAWHCLTRYCLFAGSGQFNQLANPLSLFDYSYAEALEEYGSSPLEQTVSDEALQLVDFDEQPPALPSRSMRGSLAPPSVSWQDETSDTAEDQVTDTDDDYAMPNFQRRTSPKSLPLSPERRLIPHIPSGKVEIYKAPERRPRTAGEILPPEEDDFYKVLGQTYAGPSPSSATTINHTNLSQKPDSIQFPSPSQEEQTFYRPRGVTEATSSDTTDTMAIPPRGDLRSKRERWLELTAPSYPSQKEDTVTPSQQALDLHTTHISHDLDPTNDQDYYKLVEDILRRNRFDPNAPVNTGETLSSHNQDKLKRKRPRPQ